jgi:hypothetical protein
MSQFWLGRRQSIEVPCTIEIEHTPDSLHAYVDLEGIDVEPGDEVIVHAAPVDVPFGERLVVRRMATVVRATAIEQLWTRFLSYLELTELYEVGFSAGRNA